MIISEFIARYTNVRGNPTEEKREPFTSKIEHFQGPYFIRNI
ncbi:unnamed protein product, partial [Larinioides sclopetarius]